MYVCDIIFDCESNAIFYLLEFKCREMKKKSPPCYPIVSLVMVLIMMWPAFCIRGQNKLLIHSKEDSRKWIDLNSIRKIVFSGDHFVVVHAANEESFLLADTKFWSFKQSDETALHTPEGAFRIDVFLEREQELISVFSDHIICEMMLVDLHGRTLKIVQFSTTEAAMDVSGLQPGMYILKVTTPSGSVSRKIIKN